MKPTHPVLLPPEREWKFHPTRDFRLDFAWPDLKVAVEIHGGSFSRGRHNRGVGQFKDLFKINEAQRLGWTVLQYNTLNFQNATRRKAMIEYVAALLIQRADEYTQAETYVNATVEYIQFGNLRKLKQDLASIVPGHESDHTGAAESQGSRRPKPLPKVQRTRPRVGTDPQ